MKKIMIAAAVVGLGLCFAHAGELDFDGKTISGSIEKTAILTIAEDIQIPEPTAAILPQRAFAGIEEVDKTDTFLELPAERRATFRQIASTRNTNSAKLLALIDDKNIKILYGRTGIIFLDKNAGNYAVVEESTDRSLLLGTGESIKGGNPVCKLVEYVLWKMIDGVWTQVIKQVKECSAPDNYDGITDYQNSGFPKAGVRQKATRNPVCVLVEYVLWKLVDGVWTQVFKQVKECHSDIDTDPNPVAGSGATYHNGQGGSSNYDVNKLLK